METLQPKLRFPEFSGDWNKTIFDDILDITRLAGYEYSKYWIEDDKKEIIALRGYNIGKGKIENINLGYISNELSLQLNRSRLYKGDIVYPCVGTIGNSVVIEENNKYHIQQNIAKLTPKNNISPYFISQFLMSEWGLNEVKRFNATSSQPNVLVGSLRNYRINLPLFQEQTKIANFLSAIDTKINQLTQKKNLLEQYKKGVMQKIFTQEIRFKDDNGNNFSEWVEKKMFEIGEFKNGINKSKKDFGFGVPFINLMDVFGKSTISDLNLDLVNANPNELKLYNLKKGDVLFIRSSVKKSGVGETSVVLKDLSNTVYSGFLIRFRDNKIKLDLNFKKYCFSNKKFREDLISLSSTSANTNINQESLNELKIKIPHINEQTKIANFLSAIDEKINQVSTQLEQTTQYKKGLLQQMFV